MPRSTIHLLALFLLASCATAFTQTTPPNQPPSPADIAPPASTPIPDTPQAHAETLRRYIVDQYATPDMRVAFNQPAPQQVDFKSATKTVKSMGEYQKLIMSSMDRNRIFAMAFARGLAAALLNQPVDGPSSPARPRRSALISILSGLADQAPVVGDNAATAIKATAKAREAALHNKVLANQGEGHMKSSQLFIELLLPPAQAEQYPGNNYPAKAAKLFEAAAISLRQLPFPNGMVLYLCDSLGKDAPVEDILSVAGVLAADDPRFQPASWSHLTEQQKWRIITDGAQHYFDQTAAALADPQRSAQALGSIPSTLDGSVEEKVLTALGPEGLTAYQAARGSDRTTIFNAANTINAAYQFLVMLTLGAPAEPTTTPAGTS